MAYVIINPGSGPVEGGNLAGAARNIKKLISDCKFEFEANIIVSRLELDDSNGRYAFLITDVLSERECEVEMPGLPIDRVRFISDDQNIWDFSRLYVDRSSWVWKYAISALKDSLDVILEPCPFCGSHAEVSIGGLGNPYIACEGCPARFGSVVISETKRSLIEKWNRRYHVPEDSDCGEFGERSRT